MDVGQTAYLVSKSVEGINDSDKALALALALALEGCR